MLRVSIVSGVAVAVSLLATQVRAEQKVTLQSGATLIGDVSMEGTNLVVNVDGAKIPVPFKDVASVTSVKGGDSNQPEQLLLKGLEAHALAEGDEFDLGLFAEAYRLAPDNPRVAYWYARCLVEAGNGQGAADVYEPRSEAIAAAFPGAADQLASQIKDRIALEKLPRPLVKRLDEIARAARQANAIRSKTAAYAAYFRLVDQNKKPIEKSAFRVHCNGEDGHLDSFADGYHLYTFVRRHDYGDSPCRIEVSRPGLVNEVFEFQGSSRGAQDVGLLEVKRLTDGDRKTVVVRVVDQEGKPLPEARVNITANQSDGRDRIQPATTNADGVAKLSLFPNSYHYQVSLKDYNGVGEPLVVPIEDGPEQTIDVKLYRAIRASIRVVWQARLGNHPGMPQAGDEAVTTGEFTQEAGENNHPGVFRGGPFGPQHVRLVQTGDSMQVQFVDHMGFPQTAPGSTWVGRLESTEAIAEVLPEKKDKAFDIKVATELFDVLGLSELDAIAQEFKIKRTNLGMMHGRGGPTSLPVEAGDIFVGKVHSRDPQNGRPAFVEFKILATELVRP